MFVVSLMSGFSQFPQCPGVLNLKFSGRKNDVSPGKSWKKSEIQTRDSWNSSVHKLLKQNG